MSIPTSWQHLAAAPVRRAVRGWRALLLVALLATFAMTACSSPAAVTVGEGVMVIDVRTPAEYSAGHLAGATNIDLSSAGFADAIAQLPVTGHYVVYCRSGNRSAQAASMMRDRGFEHVVDAGGLSDAAKATGLEIVSG